MFGKITCIVAWIMWIIGIYYGIALVVFPESGLFVISPDGLLQTSAGHPNPVPVPMMVLFFIIPMTVLAIYLFFYTSMIFGKE